MVLLNVVQYSSIDDKFLLCTIYLSQVVDCRVCGGSFIAGGLSKPSSKRECFSSTDVASVMKSKAPLAAAKAVVAGSPTLAGLAMPKERNSTPSNRCSTPSNRRRRSSTLKAQLAKSSSQQRHRHGRQGNSPKLTDFLTSVQ